jgi:hypothetical protein
MLIQKIIHKYSRVINLDEQITVLNNQLFNLEWVILIL